MYEVRLFIYSVHFTDTFYSADCPLKTYLPATQSNYSPRAAKYFMNWARS